MSYLTPPTGTALVSREKAETVLAAVRETFAAWLDGIDPDSPDAPHLYEPGFHACRGPSRGGRRTTGRCTSPRRHRGEVRRRIAPTTVPDDLFPEPSTGGASDLPRRLVTPTPKEYAMTDTDCTARGFTGEGRCIEPAEPGSTLCATTSPPTRTR